MVAHPQTQCFQEQHLSDVKASTTTNNTNILSVSPNNTCTITINATTTSVVASYVVARTD